MTEANRQDLATGEVPDYRTFVRHLWRYKDVSAGFEIAPPPVMYRAIFEDGLDSDWPPVRDIAEYIVDDLLMDGRIEWERIDDVDMPDAWELRFYDLKALHVFCVLLGDRARVQQDAVATRVGEFIMWTLGFRWV